MNTDDGFYQIAAMLWENHSILIAIACLHTLGCLIIWGFLYCKVPNHAIDAIEAVAIDGPTVLASMRRWVLSSLVGHGAAFPISIAMLILTLAAQSIAPNIYPGVVSVVSFSPIIVLAAVQLITNFKGARELRGYANGDT